MENSSTHKVAPDLRGIEVLNNPTLNKGTAFIQKEREGLGLVGSLPAGIETLDQQVERVLGHLAQKPTSEELSAGPEFVSFFRQQILYMFLDVRIFNGCCLFLNLPNG